jgi:PKD repeat protein
MNQREQYLNRWAAQNLSQAELDRKWRMAVEEAEIQAMYEAAILAEANANATSKGYAGGVYKVSSVMTLTVDATEDLQTEDWCFEESAPTTFTVDWGDGVIEEADGGDCIDHTYEDSGVYTVTLTFANPELITHIDFND